jgi:hypothetical protein
MNVKRVKRVPWIRILVAVVFVIGAAGNLVGEATIVEDYARWGYPYWFRYLTGMLELITVALLLDRRRRKLGAALGGMIMAAALLTLVVHGEFAHALAPAALLLALIMVAVS